MSLDMLSFNKYSDNIMTGIDSLTRPYIKTFQELYDNNIEQMKKLNINVNKGSIAKLFLALINQNTGEVYKSLNTLHFQCFLSTAEGIYLDALGLLVGCVRETDEEDDYFRYRIFASSLTNAKANETAVRLAVLSVEHVNNAIPMPYTHGAGSFTILILADDTDIDTTINNVYDVLKDTAAFGIKYYIETPTSKKASLKIKLNTIPITDTLLFDVTKTVKNGVSAYINSLSPGDTINYPTLSNIIKQSSSYIQSFSILEFKQDDAVSNIYKTTCKWNEKWVVENDNDIIIL